MAIATKDEEIREVLARGSKFFQKYDKKGDFLQEFLNDYRALCGDVVNLLNAKEATDRMVKAAELLVAKAEAEAKTRLMGIEQGHRALIDKLSKQEVELQSKTYEVEKREAAAAAVRQDYELLKAEMERKIEGLSRIKK